FGEVGVVRDWLRITGRVTRPAREHPKRPILGFACTRSEVSGTRFWGLARAIDLLSPRVIVGLGRFAELRVRTVAQGRDGMVVGGILHPSPANPRANADWAGE